MNDGQPMARQVDHALKLHCLPTEYLTLAARRRRTSDEVFHLKRTLLPIGQWRPFNAIVSSFIAGTAFAVGHHLYYNSLNGTIVPDNVDQNWDLRSQQWRLRIGVVFAFLVKMFFTISIEAAYTQLVWAHVRARDRSLKTLDSLFSGTTDPWVYFNAGYLFRSRLVPLISSICWYDCLLQLCRGLTNYRLLPLVVTITPATLSIVPSQELTDSFERVPVLDSTLPSAEAMDEYWWLRSSSLVSPSIFQITSATATAGTVLPMDIVFPESAYNVNFQAPSLQCKSPDSFTVAEIDDIFEYAGKATWKSIRESDAELWDDATDDNGECLPIYVAFTPTSAAFRSAQDEQDQGSHSSHGDLWMEWTRNCVLGSSGLCSANLDLTGPNPLYDPLWLRLGKQRVACSVQRTTFNVTFKTDGSMQRVVKTPTFEWLGYYDEIDFLLYTVLSQALIDILQGSIVRCITSNGFRNLASAQTSIMATEMSSIVANTIEQLTNITISSKPSHRDFSPRWPARNETFSEMIEELSRNQTISLFSDSRFWLVDIHSCVGSKS